MGCLYDFVGWRKGEREEKKGKGHGVVDVRKYLLIACIPATHHFPLESTIHD